MRNKDKILLLEKLNQKPNLTVEMVYQTLEKMDSLKYDYHEYMTIASVNCEKELLRLPDSNYDLCCALLTMLLREDYFSNGSFEKRQRRGQISLILERMVSILKAKELEHISAFSEKSLQALNGFYVYALVDPRDDKVFYVGKGIGNRVFAHEAEDEKIYGKEKKKLKKIQEIEECGLFIKRIIVNWGLNENEAFAAEATLLNMLKCMKNVRLTNEVSGHGVHESLTVEEFELQYGAVALNAEDIKHSILVIKINRLYRRNMSAAELYDTVRGFWNASLKSIEQRKVEYVFGVYNSIVVAVYRPDEWHYGYEMIDIPQRKSLTPKDYDKIQKRVYFTCKDFNFLDVAGQFYLHKSIAKIKYNQSAQNPITYLSPEKKAK